jgi:predicted transcriptional regulator
MPLEKIVVRVAGETDLDSTISKLEKLGTVDKKNADSFKATSATAKKSFSDIDKAADSHH